MCSVPHLSLDPDYKHPDTVTKSDPPPRCFEFYRLVNLMETKKRSQKYSIAPALPSFKENNEILIIKKHYFNRTLF